jgi:hypothetical protein
VGASLPARRLLHPRSPRCVRTLRRRPASGYASTQHGTAGPAAPWTPPGVKPGSRTPHRYGPSQPPRLPLQPLHPLAGELAWRTAIRAGCGGPLGRPAGRRPQPAWSAPPAGRPDCRGEETCAGGAANSSTGRSPARQVGRGGRASARRFPLGRASWRCRTPTTQEASGGTTSTSTGTRTPSPGLLMAWSSAMGRGMARAIALLSGS